ncbi:MAG: 30S ribosome-binding factor RbfA [Patescibacteria group bacterium]|jgi:ribosome-binding factor A
MSSRRVEKVSELLRQQLSEQIRLNLPEELGIITVTAVDVNDDLKEANVYISCLNEASQKPVLNILFKKTQKFQQMLGKNLSMKFTPKLHFKIDKGLQKVNRIEELLDEIEKQ